jgi:hypothetical protein
MLAVLTVVWPTRATAGPPAVDGLAERLRELPANVLSDGQRQELADAVRMDLRNRLQAANDRSSGLWRKIQSRADWELFRDRQLGLLRKSLGQFPQAPEEPEVRVSGSPRDIFLVRDGRQQTNAFCFAVGRGAAVDRRRVWGPFPRIEQLCTDPRLSSAEVSHHAKETGKQSALRSG